MSEEKLEHKTAQPKSKNKPSSLTQLVDKLRLANKKLKVKLKQEMLSATLSKSELIKSGLNELQTKVLELEKQNSTYKNLLDIFIKQNKRVFYKHNATAEELAQETEKSITSMRMVILDFEYTFTGQKLFEMHICDCIIDKLFVLGKLSKISDDALKVMFTNTKHYVISLIQNQALHDKLNIEALRASLRAYVKGQIKWLCETIADCECESMNILS